MLLMYEADKDQGQELDMLILLNELIYSRTIL